MLKGIPTKLEVVTYKEWRDGEVGDMNALEMCWAGVSRYQTRTSTGNVNEPVERGID